MEIQDIDLKELIEKETGERFKQGYIKCPFHNEKTPSLSIKFFPDANKYKYMCWGCRSSGDAVDFIQQLKGLDYVDAREYLGLSVEKTAQEELIDKVHGYIEWEMSKHRKGQQLLGIFPFTDKSGNTVYFKAKFKDKDGKKSLSYYHIEGDKVINKRGCDELPYNLYKACKGMEEDKVIIIAEGEKDVNTLNSVLRGEGYVATSVKGCKDISMFDCNRIYVCSDTGKAGEDYKWSIFHALHEDAKEFKFINLPGIKDLGDNKDITDWMDAGHTKTDLLNAFERSLNLKSKYDLQQDKKGIYKYAANKKDEGEEISYRKKYITDFKLASAARIKYINDDAEGVKLVLLSPTGAKIERVGLSTVFDDVRSFKNFLSSIDLAFKGSIEDLTELKIWVNKYFALEVDELYSGIQFAHSGDEMLFITNEGALTKDNKMQSSIKSDGKDEVQVLKIEPITSAELRQIKEHIFRFASPEKAITIIGTVINNMAVAQCEELNIKLHHLMLVGEGGSGKSTILERVIAPILNYPLEERASLGLATNFSLIRDLSDGNYTMLYDEHKPSKWDRYKIAKTSEILRNLYDRAAVSRGDKSFKTKKFYLRRPVIIAGEESYHNNEKALMDRSNIIYMSKNERKAEETEALDWIINNTKLLNKLGRSILDMVLDLSSENYNQIRNKISNNDSLKELRDRPLNTAINTAAGIEIFNLLLKKHKISTIPIKNYMPPIVRNVKIEILEGGSEAHSIVEQMICLYNEMLEDKRCEGEIAFKKIGDELFIRTSEMLNQIRVYIKNTAMNMAILENKDFLKQAKKAGYILGSKVLRGNDGDLKRYDVYNAEMLRKLNVSAIIPPDVVNINEVVGEEETAQQIPFGY